MIRKWFLNMMRHFNCAQCDNLILNNYFKIASIPGKVLPSKLSNIAPPPVET